MFLFFLSILILVFFALSILIWTFKNSISPMPSTVNMRRAFFRHLSDQNGKKVVELGSGWGHLAVGMAKKYPRSQIVAYENSPLPWLFSFFLKGKLSVKTLYADFFSQDLKEFDTVVCYLCRYSMSRLKSKFSKELKPGTEVVSLVFAIDGWEPETTVYADDLYRSPIYFYKVPENTNT